MMAGANRMAAQVKHLAWLEEQRKAGRICRYCHYFEEIRMGWGDCTFYDQDWKEQVEEVNSCVYFEKWEGEV